MRATCRLSKKKIMDKEVMQRQTSKAIYLKFFQHLFLQTELLHEILQYHS